LQVGRARDYGPRGSRAWRNGRRKGLKSISIYLCMFKNILKKQQVSLKSNSDNG
jgi:hypothetical protein